MSSELVSEPISLLTLLMNDHQLYCLSPVLMYQLKDSHVEIIRRVMRDYHKLDNTIFVINKMDELINSVSKQNWNLIVQEIKTL